MTTNLHPSDLQGLSRLAIDGVAGTVGLVEHLHYTIFRVSAPVGRAAHGRTGGITGMVYRSILGVTGLVGGTVEFAFNQFTSDSANRHSAPERERLLAIINGVIGDHLAASANPLAIEMQLRRQGQALSIESGALAAAIDRPSPRLLIAVHGLCLDDLRWTPKTGESAVDIPATLARQLGYTNLCLHYNTGRPIATNGREFAVLLEQLVEQWPVPVEEVVLLGHSMGGLVSRSACHYACDSGHRWPEKLRRMIFLGTPHHGSPLERAGHLLEQALAISPYSAPFNRLGAIRSAGITDLRHGRILDTDFDTDQDISGARMPDHVGLHAIAATRAERADSAASRLFGDGLVPIDSALGRHPDPARHLPIPPEHQHILPATRHVGLLHHPQACQTIHRWLR